MVETLVNGLTAELATVPSSLLAGIAEELEVRTVSQSTWDIFIVSIIDLALEQEQH